MRGGYKIIDLSGIDIHTDSTTVVKGVYERIEGNYGKPLLIHGLIHNDIAMEDIWLNMLPVPGFYMGTFVIREGSNTIQIIININSEDSVQISRVTLGGN